MSYWMRVGSGSNRTCNHTYQRNLRKFPFRMSEDVRGTPLGLGDLRLANSEADLQGFREGACGEVADDNAG